MSGLIDKIKKMISPDKADQAADMMEKNVTDERVDDAVGRVPGGDKVAGKIPDDAGQKAADATRERFGSKKKDETS